MLLPLVERYLASLHITFPTHELHYGAALILGASRIAPNHSRRTIVQHQWDTVANSVRYIEEQTQLPFSQDHILVQQIHEYCLSARVRWVTRIHSYVNLHKEVIKSREPVLYHTIVEAVQLYSKYADSIREDDIADFTMYFVASRKGHHLQLKEKTILLYMSDPGVMRYAMLKLLDHLNGQIKIVTTNQAQEIAHLVAHQYVDVIITTNKHNYALLTNEVPVIQVSPLLSNYEINMIKDTLHL